MLNASISAAILRKYLRRYRLALGRIKDLAFCALEVAERPRRKFDGEVFQIPSLRQASADGIPSPLANCASDSSRAAAISRSSLDVSWATDKRDSAVSLTMANSLGSASRRCSRTSSALMSRTCHAHDPAATVFQDTVFQAHPHKCEAPAPLLTQGLQGGSHWVIRPHRSNSYAPLHLDLFCLKASGTSTKYARICTLTRMALS